MRESDLPAIRQALADEKEKEYPEATMWGNLPAKGFYLRHTSGIRLEDVTVTTDEADVRPEVVRE